MSQTVLMRMVLGCGSVGCCRSSCVGGLGFCMVLYMGYVYIRLAQKHALTNVVWAIHLPVPYTDSDLIKSFISIIFMGRAYSTARAMSRLVTDFSLTRKK
jgi:hypothetical protein